MWLWFSGAIAMTALWEYSRMVSLSGLKQTVYLAVTAVVGLCVVRTDELAGVAVVDFAILVCCRAVFVEKQTSHTGYMAKIRLGLDADAAILGGLGEFAW